jgi:hypothetical protein
MQTFNNEPSLCESRSIGDKTLGVDEIISEQNKVPINKIDVMLQRSYKSDTIPPNTRVGDSNRSVPPEIFLPRDW